MSFRYSEQYANATGGGAANFWGAVVAIVAAFIMVVSALFFGLPMWNVWRSGLSGEAKMKSAEQTRKILVIQAEAERDAAKLRAEAIAIVGKAATDFPAYRQQEFLGAFAEALKEGHISQIMYIPTEAGIPITEAGRKSIVNHVAADSDKLFKSKD